MENYDEACKCRLSDIDALLAGPDKRTTAAVHLGGVAVNAIKLSPSQPHR